MIRRIIVAGGGTGGHLFPGLAVVEELRRREPSLEFLFVGTARGIEARVIPERGEQLELLEVTPLKGRSPAQLVKSIAKLPGAMGHAANVVRRFKPDLVLGVGGYASGPILAAAASMGVPTALLEQNAHVGLTNRILSPMVGRAYLTFPETAERFREKSVRVAGNPVRRDFVEASRRAVADPEGFEARADTLLVLGGSQGARSLNQTVPEALARVEPKRRKLRVIHQTGQAMRDEVALRYAQLGVEAEVVPFIEDMARAYASATVVIGRAGATTLAEICAVGRPSILIPFPHAADDHQAKNAEALEAAGAAICIREDALDAEVLGDRLAGLLDDADARREMATAARGRGKPDAAASIVDDLFAWLGEPGDGGPQEPQEPECGPEPASEPGAEPGDDGGYPRASLRGNRYYRPQLDSWRPAPRKQIVRRPLVMDGSVWE